MCFKVQCNKCGKYTWQGCGQHAAEVMAAIPPEQRCTCPRDSKSLKSSRHIFHPQLKVGILSCLMQKCVGDHEDRLSDDLLA